jgi:hypothetical protein
MNIREFMTKEEQALLDKLKLEILNAVSVADLLFYKKELNRITEDIRKRGQLIQKM